MIMKYRLLILATCLAMLAGCGGKPATDGDGSGPPPSFSLAWSEYPSWSVFGVASERELIDGDKGKLGPIEEQWGVDIVLKELDYDTCLTAYGSGEADAVCMTNMDSLAPSLGRDSVAVLPTSTSVGADACIAVGIDDLEGLKGKPTFGLEMSVSQYAFERNLELQNADPAEYPFTNMDPAAAATAMQTGDAKVTSIMVWNPFVLQTLRTRDGTKVLFDSSTIPEEIIDMVVVGKDVVEKPGGEKFVCAVIDTFYQVNKLLADPEKGDEALVDLGAKFSNLGLDDMKIVVDQTRFYKTPDDALKLYEDEKFQNETMPMVVDFCVDHGIVSEKPNVGFGVPDAQLNFDVSYILKVKDKK
jgi:ABC-type nitrate/sulfonate/bicarbonate transport system substrate-binding protein